ncbi:MAG: hypothetical protein ABIA47_01200 [bacterium]
MTGEQLFLRYAWPCAVDKVVLGIIRYEHYAEMRECLHKGQDPQRKRLKFCFPNAFKATRAFAELHDREVWSLENVRDYWRSGHAGKGECAVFRATVIASGSVASTVQLEDKERKKVLNPYSLAIHAHQTVYIHKGCVVEIG